jgi:hypothetical protein
LVALVRSGESPDSLRNQLAARGDAFSVATLIAFDVLYSRLSKNSLRIGRFVKVENVSPYLKKLILAGLRSGALSYRDIRNKFGIARKVVRQIRRAAPPFKQKFTTRRLNAPKIEKATDLLKAGHSWRGAARKMGVGCKTLLTHVPYRKRRVFPLEEWQSILTRLENGESCCSVARDVKMPRSTLRKRVVAYKEQCEVQSYA